MILAASFIATTLVAPAWAQPPKPIHYSGTGVFSPTNIGTPKGGNAGIIIGDGSGISEYTASGDDFAIGGELVGSGRNDHVGANTSITTGILNPRTSVIRWPTKGIFHVLSSDDGDLHLEYVGAYTFDVSKFMAGEPSFGATALWKIVGGTDRFVGAKGVLWMEVEVPVVLEALPPPGVSPDIPFTYEFDGFIHIQGEW
ncbi:hypothetical protein [Tautonia rosea]|uniref:hypothetical protein n=1 Tax=Tautonia rosea TaxID=2728037 RepID=UPI0014759451|nr:hypothetical protein [Tautonia rosea]